ncbi:MAG TPA: PPK2 family polyphosphate kinase [Gammaproteobacteria bacterium]|nr:PPK2 family polyphosphate kinase [Gammaproteobacteria bacterium]
MFEADPHPHLVPFNESFRIAATPTAPTDDRDAKAWKGRLEKATKELGAWQDRLYADGRYAVLFVFQAIDAAGKDGTIRHVFDGVNPCGLRVASFKQPSRVEVAHDFLWRSTLELPRRGEIGVFNRSYYEEVLVVRVHPELLAAQRLDTKPNAELWSNRLRSIVEYERHLATQGTVIVKFFLNMSKDEQRDRLLARLDEADKLWKFNVADLAERDRWADYQDAYERCLNATSKPWAPWYAIPADDKHYMRSQVASVVNETFERLDVKYPEPRGEQLRELKAARAKLAAE